MTREEAIQEIKDAANEALECWDNTNYKPFKLELEHRIMAFEMAIEALNGKEK